jgi:hypothetical protein
VSVSEKPGTWDLIPDSWDLNPVFFLCALCVSERDMALPVAFFVSLFSL